MVRLLRHKAQGHVRTRRHRRRRARVSGQATGWHRNRASGCDENVQKLNEGADTEKKERESEGERKRDRESRDGRREDTASPHFSQPHSLTPILGRSDHPKMAQRESIQGTVDAECARECRRRIPAGTCMYSGTSARPKFHNLQLSGNNTGLHVYDCAALGWGAPYGDGVVLQRDRLGRIVAARIQARRHVCRVHHLQLQPGAGPRGPGGYGGPSPPSGSFEAPGTSCRKKELLGRAAAAKQGIRGRRAGTRGGGDGRCPLSRISRRPTRIRGLIPPCALTRLRCAPTLVQWQRQAIPADTLGAQGPGMHGAGLPGIDKVFPLASESGGGEERGEFVRVCAWLLHS